MIPNKYTALERLQLFKQVASFGTLKNALIEECEQSGEPIGDPSIEQVFEFASLIGFECCENESCDLWYNHRKEWFYVSDGKKICRMCNLTEGNGAEV